MVKRITLEFPSRPLEKGGVLKVVEAIGAYGGTAIKDNVEDFVKVKGGALGELISSAKRYNLITDKGRKYVLTNLGIEFLKAKSEEEGRKTLIKVFLSVPLFRHIVKEKDFVEIPQFGVLKKIVSEEYKIPEDYAGTAANVFRRSLEFLKVPFSQIKETLQELSVEEVKPITKVEEFKPLPQIESSTDLIKVGYLLGYLSTATDVSKSALLSVLDEIIKQVRYLPTILKEVEKAKELLEEGYLDEKGVLRYARNKFAKALDIDLNIKLSEIIEEGKLKKMSEKEKSKAPVT